MRPPFVESVNRLPRTARGRGPGDRRRGVRGSAGRIAGTRGRALSIRFLLDTNVLSEPIKSQPDVRVLVRIEEHEGEVATCAIVWHELWYGAVRLPASKKRRAIETYLDEAVRTALPILPCDEKSAAWHARERARPGRRGRPPSAVDGQIAAIAGVNELVLVTANVRDFRRFEGLSVQDWRR